MCGPESKSLLCFFIRRIEVRGRELALDYTIALHTKKAEPRIGKFDLSYSLALS
jgi:hypothetical protein